MGLEKNETNLDYAFSKLKALADSEKFQVIVFQYSAKNDNSELGIFTSKHYSTCHRKIPSYPFCV